MTMATLPPCDFCEIRRRLHAMLNYVEYEAPFFDSPFYDEPLIEISDALSAALPRFQCYCEPADEVPA